MKDKLRQLAIVGLWLVACTLCSSCGGGGGDGESSQQICSEIGVGTRVIGGEKCSPSRSPVVAIVSTISGETIDSTCSGSLVTLDDVLTAAHCLTNLPPGAIPFVFADGNVWRIVKAAIHPLYDGVAGNPFDLAMLTIEVPLSIPPLAINRSDPVESGEAISIYGYGLNEDFTGTAGDFRGATMIVDKANEFLISALPQTTNTSFCQGDSGGPGIQQVGGSSAISGVISFGSQPAGTTPCFTDLEQATSVFVSLQNDAATAFIRSYAPDVSIR